MHITRCAYNRYLLIMYNAQKRIKRDKQIIRIVNKLIHTKNISPSDQEKLNKLLEEEVK